MANVIDNKTPNAVVIGGVIWPVVNWFGLSDLNQLVNVAERELLERENALAKGIA